jgi:hypothetical protein
MTPKQQAITKLISENICKVGERKSLGEMALEAGYSESMSKTPAKILSSKQIEPIIEEQLRKVDQVRDNALDEISPKKLKKTPALQLAYISGEMLKERQILTGGITERIGLRDETAEFKMLIDELKQNETGNKEKVSNPT